MSQQYSTTSCIFYTHKLQLMKTECEQLIGFMLGICAFQPMDELKIGHYTTVTPEVCGCGQKKAHLLFLFALEAMEMADLSEPMCLRV